jgi:hypothetical protein
MFSTLLFGIQNSPQRKIMVVLAGLLIVIGILFIPFYDGEGGTARGVVYGLVFIALGLATVAIVSRVFAAHDNKVGTQEQLKSIAEGYNTPTDGLDAPTGGLITPDAGMRDEP